LPLFSHLSSPLSRRPAMDDILSLFLPWCDLRVLFLFARLALSTTNRTSLPSFIAQVTLSTLCSLLCPSLISILQVTRASRSHLSFRFSLTSLVPLLLHLSCPGALATPPFVVALSLFSPLLSNLSCMAYTSRAPKHNIVFPLPGGTEGKT
jgi:hypothetical protein